MLTGSPTSNFLSQSTLSCEVQRLASKPRRSRYSSTLTMRRGATLHASSRHNVGDEMGDSRSGRPPQKALQSVNLAAGLAGERKRLGHTSVARFARLPIKSKTNPITRLNRPKFIIQGAACRHPRWQITGVAASRAFRWVNTDGDRYAANKPHSMRTPSAYSNTAKMRLSVCTGNRCASRAPNGASSMLVIEMPINAGK